MRQITREFAQAICSGGELHKSNSRVEGGKGYLFGNCIAKREGALLYINNCGYTSNTTKERLNGLLEIWGNGQRIYQKDFVWYIEGDKGPVEFPCNEWVQV